VAVLCKLNGWLTVSSKTMKRSDAIEKRKEQVKCRHTSAQGPEWMQLSHPHSDLKNELKGKSTKNPFSRVEKNRVILYDQKQPLLTG